MEIDESNKTADAFYSEDWEYFNKRFRKLPTCHAEAEMIMNKALQN